MHDNDDDLPHCPQIRAAFERAGVEDGELEDFIRISYLQELLDVAIILSKDTSDNPSLVELKKTFTELGISTIRNRVSHPNNPISENDWYSLASFATSEEIQELKMTNVNAALKAAQEGTIKDIPAEWFATKTLIPCHISTKLEHVSTGLIGRNKELKELKKLLLQLRVNQVAVIARGGLGKTALVLELLERLSVDITSSQFFDSIIFSTFKRDQLTESGLIQLDNEKSIEGLERNLSGIIHDLWGEPNPSLNFEETCRKFKNKKILLCLDNLETLLRDEPESLKDFLHQIPIQWKVLVTSRITVDGFHTFPLKSLEKNSAMGLATRYASITGDRNLSKENVEQIVTKTDCNPLAIRLTVDFLNKEKPFIESLAQGTHQTIEFSFTNLLETLSEDSIYIIEALYILERASRMEVCGLLDFSVDRAAEALSELRKTSLIIHEIVEAEDFYSLTSSIKEMVIKNPRNISIRGKIQTDFENRSRRIDNHRRITESHDVSSNSRYYIPSDIPDSLYDILITVVRSIRASRNDKIAESHEELNGRISEFKSFPCYHYFKSLCLMNFEDRLGAKSLLKDCLNLDPTHLWARLDYAEILLKEFNPNSFADAKIIAESLLEDDSVIQSEEKHKLPVYRLYYRSLIHLEDFDKILEETEDWEHVEKYPLISSLKAGFRAKSLHNKVRNLHRSAPLRAAESILEAAKILHKSAKSFGDKSFLGDDMSALCREIVYLLYKNNKIGENETKDVFYCILVEVDKAFESFMMQSDTLAHEELTKNLIKLHELKAPWLKPPLVNPFSLKGWKQRLFPGSDQPVCQKLLDEFIGRGFRIAKIYSAPKGPNAFKYAQEIDSKEKFFLPKRNFVSGDSIKWKQLILGSPVAILPEEKASYGKLKSALKIELLQTVEYESPTID
ncbi:tetratricopeptide repeat protein [Akkermansiaceae bacterium]|nr:tetratricopeptide repeat protein [Akkermansiaceae bacterium]MDB4391285.1 tetratricopeptide repeat protein [Akkermansiaceae bacterium]